MTTEEAIKEITDVGLTVDQAFAVAKIMDRLRDSNIISAQDYLDLEEHYKRKSEIENFVLNSRVVKLTEALYRTRKDRDKYLKLYEQQKARADKYKVKHHEKRLELYKLKKK